MAKYFRRLYSKKEKRWIEEYIFYSSRIDNEETAWQIRACETDSVIREQLIFIEYV
jgi:hypothetical protein